MLRDANVGYTIHPIAKWVGEALIGYDQFCNCFAAVNDNNYTLFQQKKSSKNVSNFAKIAFNY